MVLPDFTRVRAVNDALTMVGQTPIQTLGSGVNAISTMAENILDEATRTILAMGWWFNTAKKVDFTPNSANEIVVGDSVYELDSSDADEEFIKRGRRVYDQATHSFTTFTKSTYTLDTINELEWLDIPILCRDYIAKRTARQLVERVLDDNTINKAAAIEEQRSKESMVFANTRQADINILRDNANRWQALNYGGRGALERGLI